VEVLEVELLSSGTVVDGCEVTATWSFVKPAERGRFSQIVSHIYGRTVRHNKMSFGFFVSSYWDSGFL